MFLTVLWRVSGDAEIKDNNRSRTRLSGTGVFWGRCWKKVHRSSLQSFAVRRLVVPVR